MGNKSGVKMIPDCLLSSLGRGGGGGRRLKCQTFPPNKQTTIKPPNWVDKHWTLVEKNSTDSLKL